MLDFGHEQRRVRFASIIGLERADLPLAGEVWQADMCVQPWCKREFIKLAMVFTSYMAEPSERLADVSFDAHDHESDVAADDSEELAKAMPWLLFRRLDGSVVDGAARLLERIAASEGRELEIDAITHVG